MTKDQFTNKLKLCYALSEIQNLYISEINAAMKRAGFKGFQDKEVISAAIKQTKKVMTLVRSVTSKDYSSSFEDNVDELKFTIDQTYNL